MLHRQHSIRLSMRGMGWATGGAGGRGEGTPTRGSAFAVAMSGRNSPPRERPADDTVIENILNDTVPSMGATDVELEVTTEPLSEPAAQFRGMGNEYFLHLKHKELEERKQLAAPNRNIPIDLWHDNVKSRVVSVCVMFSVLLYMYDFNQTVMAPAYPDVAEVATRANLWTYLYWAAFAVVYVLFIAVGLMGNNIGVQYWKVLACAVVRTQTLSQWVAEQVVVSTVFMCCVLSAGMTNSILSTQ